MAITTSLRPSYKWRLIIMAVICPVFGVLGIWDYYYRIPAKQRAYEQFRVLESARTALQAVSTDDDYRKRYTDAIEIVGSEIDTSVGAIMAKQGMTSRSVKDTKDGPFFATLLDLSDGEVVEAARARQEFAEAEQAATAIGATKEGGWIQESLLLYQALINTARRPPRPPDQPHTGLALRAWERTQDRLDAIGRIKPPSKFDHLMQWGFILCLPFTPYFVWKLWKLRNQKYVLEDDGALHAPEGDWARDEIEAINMDRWMAKSVATVKTSDGTEVVLDDYIHRNLHLIVGAIAHRFDPAQWNEDATKVKAVAVEDESDDTPADKLTEAATKDV